MHRVVLVCHLPGSQAKRTMLVKKWEDDELKKINDISRRIPSSGNHCPTVARHGHHYERVSP